MEKASSFGAKNDLFGAKNDHFWCQKVPPPSQKNQSPSTGPGMGGSLKKYAVELQLNSKLLGQLSVNHPHAEAQATRGL